MHTQLGKHSGVIGSTETSHNSWVGYHPITYVYERYTRGFGDAIMLRPAIVASIKQRPRDKHILHIYDNVTDLFSDIKGLTTIPLNGFNKKYQSREFIDNYENTKLFELSTCDANYEMEHMDCLTKSRQEIYCDVVGVKFSKRNYDFKFTNDELTFALDYIGDKECIGVHLKSAEKWRDYRFIHIKKDQLKMWNLVDELAKRYDGYVVVFDNKLRYKGKKKNVISCVGNSIRKTLAVMSLMNIGIGVDSFGVHGFGMLGIPVYGIFGPTDARVRLKYNAVYWSPPSECEYQPCWYAYNRCLSGISCINSRTSKFYVDDILDKMSIYLGI